MCAPASMWAIASSPLSVFVVSERLVFAEAACTRLDMFRWFDRFGGVGYCCMSIAKNIKNDKVEKED